MQTPAGSEPERQDPEFPEHGTIRYVETESAALDRARAGDEQAFRELTEPYRRELQVHCYRLLGSLTDAEDMLQETLLAAWRGLAGYQRRASLRSWLYRIATNECLDALRTASRRIVPEPIPPFQPPEPTRRGEITWLQPYPDALIHGIADSEPGPEARYAATEAIELAFVAALQRMTPRQAAALVLRDVIGFDAGEVAEMLGTTQIAVKGILQRARAALGEGRSATRQRDPRTERTIASQFAKAYVNADIDGIIALLTDEAWLSMPPAPHQYHGRDAIRAFLRASFAYRGDSRLRLVPVSANTQPAFASYVTDAPSAKTAPGGLFVLTIAAGKITAITRFHRDDLYPRFGLSLTG
jgi:RNA polymerase sigma-70 factor (TIGR02960 family)